MWLWQVSLVTCCCWPLCIVTIITVCPHHRGWRSCWWSHRHHHHHHHLPSRLTTSNPPTPHPTTSLGRWSPGLSLVQGRRWPAEVWIWISEGTVRAGGREEEGGQQREQRSEPGRHGATSHLIIMYTTGQCDCDNTTNISILVVIIPSHFHH